MTGKAFEAELQDRFSGDFRVRYHLAPPLLGAPKDARGRPVKRAYGAWLRGPLRLLAAAKGLRGSVFNPFGLHAEARLSTEEKERLLAWSRGE